MAFLILPNGARKQPAKQTPLNQKHWLARDATFAISGVLPIYDAANDKCVPSLSPGGSGWTRRGTEKGYSLYTPNGGWADFGLSQDWIGPNTIIALCRVNSVDSSWGGLFSKQTSSTITQFSVGRYAAEDVFYCNIGGSAVRFTGSSVSGLTGFNVLAFTHSGESSAGANYYKNGNLVSTTASLGTQPSGTGALGLGRSRDLSASFDSDVDWVAFVRFKRALDSREIAEVSRNFWDLWEPDSRRILFLPSSGSATGSVSYTNADDTSSASGTTTVIGSVSAANASDTVSASGSPVIVGSLAVSNADDSVSASGSVGSAVSGNISYTNQDDTVAATGTTTVTGSSAVTNSDDTASASGSVGSATSGSVNYANADDAASATGTTAVVGSVSATNAGDSAAGTGTTTVTGSLATVNANDSVSASGSIGSSVSGSVAYTNADDSIAASGTTTVTGAAGTANADDTAAASGEVVDVVTGSASVTNADDTAAAAGTITILGELLTLNRNDSAIASGMVNDGAVVESLLVSSVSRVKKPGIPNDAPAWLRTTLEILTGRRGNRIEVPKAKTLTFSATPTKEECEALYSHIQEVRDSLEQLINRQDS